MACRPSKLANLNKIIAVSIDWGGGGQRKEQVNILLLGVRRAPEGVLTAGISTHWLLACSPHLPPERSCPKETILAVNRLINKDAHLNDISNSRTRGYSLTAQPQRISKSMVIYV